jgi:hypothetical protein
MGQSNERLPKFGDIDTGKLFDEISTERTDKEQFCMLIGLLETAAGRIARNEVSKHTVQTMMDVRDFDDPNRGAMEKTLRDVEADTELQSMFVAITRPIIRKQIDELFDAKAIVDGMTKLAEDTPNA